MNHIRVATEVDRDAVNQLRVGEYARSPEFDLLDPAPIMWHPADAGVVLVAVAAGRIVATMSGTVVEDRTAAEELLECRVRTPLALFPALILTRAATCEVHRALGLNTALRLHFFSAADAVASVLGAVYAGAPRLGVLTQLGYEFEPEPSWEQDVRAHSRRSLVVLAGPRIPEAVSLLSRIAEGVLAGYPWMGLLPSLVSPNQALQQTGAACRLSEIHSSPRGPGC